jgi:TonB family protein
MEVLKYVKYCLSLFEECTVNGLGSFQFSEAPPEKDINNNVVKKKYYIIVFNQQHVNKPRLTNILTSKEGCSLDQANSAVHLFATNIHDQIKSNKEVWLSEVGLLKKTDGNDIALLSHKFPVKSFKASDGYSTEASAKTSINTPTTLPANASAKDLLDALTLPTTTKVTSNNNNTDTLGSFEKLELVTTNKEETSAKKIDNLIDNAEVPKISSSAAILPTVSEKEKDGTSTLINSSVENDEQEETKPVFLPSFAKKYGLYTGIAASILLAILLFVNFAMKKEVVDLSANKPLAEQPSNSNGTQQVSLQQEDVLPITTSVDATDKTKELLKEEKDKEQANKEAKDKLAEQTLQKNEASIAEANTTNANTKGTVIPFNADDMPPAVVDKDPSSSVVKTELNSLTTVQPLREPQKKEIPVAENTAAAIATEPEFPGGTKAVDKYIKEKLQYPDKALEEGIAGTVKVSFTIDENGGVKDFEVLDGIGWGCDEEAIRVVKRLNKWIPATKNGSKVASRKTLRITFKPSSK